MTGTIRRFRHLCLATAGALSFRAASPLPASDASEVQAAITKWVADFNKAIQATPGTLTIGKAIYIEIANNTAYYIYPATFKDTQKGKPVTYKGTWTMTLQKTPTGWVFTGSASAWGVNTL